MRERTRGALSSIHEPVERQWAWEWARDNVDFSRAPNYDTPIHGPFDPEFTPFLKEPCEAIDDPDVQEVWVRKPSRAAGSECLILNPIRKDVATSPCPSLYMSSDQLSTERFFTKRIKLGFECSAVTDAKYRAAHSTEHEINFEDMDLVATWPAAKGAFKQSGYKRIYVDECSLLPNTAPGMIRKRTDTYSLSTIVFISAPDPVQKRPSRDDPIFFEMEETDKRKLFFPDPKTGNLFTFEMGVSGKNATRHGLKWSASAKRSDGSWDMVKVRKTAHYVTPDGTKISNAQKAKLIPKFAWIPTNPDAPKEKRGYIYNCFVLPFKSGDFGQIACAFLEAKKAGPAALRVFVYEYLAEWWHEDTEAATDDALKARCRHYEKGTLLSQCEQEPTKGVSYANLYLPKPKVVLGTVDVQKAHQWYLFREWIEGGDSGLVDYGYAVTWTQIEKKGDEHGAHRIGVDYAYESRRAEVFEYAAECQAWPLMGRASLDLPYLQKAYDPKEGKRGQSSDEENKIKAYEFNDDIFSTMLLSMIRGESPKNWCLYSGIDREYVRQVNSTQKLDGKWGRKRGYSQDHLWDCEKMQVVLALIMGIFTFDFFKKEK